MSVALAPEQSFVRLGRAVTFDDMLEVHKRARGTCEHCLGSGRIRKHVPASSAGPARIAIQYCYLALQDLQAEGMQRIVERPGTGDAHWLAGCSPEEWPFTMMWMADDFAIQWRRAFSWATRHARRRAG